MARKSAARHPAEVHLDSVTVPQPVNQTTLTAQLTSGGEIALVAGIDVLRLSPDDRAFVFDLVDKIEAYVQARQQAAAERAA